MRKKFGTIAAALTLAFSALTFQIGAEIEYIRVKWLPVACQASCIADIARQFLSISSLAEVVVNEQQGQATLRWKPRVPFSYNYINSAMRLVGPTVQDVRMRVRGTITVTPTAVILQSLGDETQFILLSPTPGSLTQYVPQNNIDAHRLAPDVRQKFIDGQRDSTVVVVEGPLFEPQRMQGLYLIVQQATFNRLQAKN